MELVIIGFVASSHERLQLAYNPFWDMCQKDFKSSQPHMDKC